MIPHVAPVELEQCCTKRTAHTHTHTRNEVLVSVDLEGEILKIESDTMPPLYQDADWVLLHPTLSQ